MRLSRFIPGTFGKSTWYAHCISGHMSTLRKPINLVFLAQVLVVFMVAFGVIPRTIILPLAILMAIFVLWADLETSTAFFIRSVPIFVAIPFTSYFDSFSIWRIASGLIFLKWFYKSARGEVKTVSKSAIHLLENPRAKATTERERESGEPSRAYPESRVGGMADLLIAKIRKYPIASLLILFILLSLLSLLVANDFFTGIKRIIYLINLSLVPIVIYDLIKKSPTLTKKFLSNILISGFIVAGVGLAQLISAYLVPLNAFLDFWGNTVQLGFYGYQWVGIAMEGNTWFAYFGDQLSLRVFSTFPDSHSFPVYLLMTIPSLLTLAWSKVIHIQGRTLYESCPQRAWLTILLSTFYLLAILSGTRGIWLAILGPLLTLPFLIRYSQTKENKTTLKKLGLLLLPFFALFVIAFPIMSSNQFWVEKENNQILAKRIRSILDLNETSNSGRVEIWKKTAASIIKHPLLGVGIGNFPTVLSQHTDLAKAGSSAHNLYLNIAAEIGLVGLLAALGILAIILKRGWAVFTSFSFSTNQGSTRYFLQKVPGRTFIKIYSAALLLYSLWVLFYSLTDAILFDERAFLIFAINSAIILGLYPTHNQQSPSA